MNKKEKGSSGVAAPEGAKAGKFLSQSDFPCLDSNTSSTNFQGTIASLLHRGRENALTSCELVKLTGCRTNRDLQLQIAAERENGALILSASSGSGGYFLPAAGEQGRRELMEFERTLKSRAVHTLAALRPARRALKRLEGQTGGGE